MNLIRAVSEPLLDYYDAIPANTKSEVLNSFKIGSIVYATISRNLLGGIYCGALSATASLIYALITPLMRSISGRAEFTGTEEFIRTGIAMLAAVQLATAFTNQHTFYWLDLDPNLYKGIPFSLIGHYIRACGDQISFNTDRANCLFVIPFFGPIEESFISYE
ncbi:MAG: hypothetical protein K2X50_09755 [Gammaproteobacteria bacterium]|nr:hypothetical protein [Gammaproteobacteria bacterium]